MHRVAIFTAALFLFPLVSQAGPIVFDTDPFAGTLALVTAGRQIEQNEPFIDFDIANDRFVFDLTALAPYAFGPNISVANDVIANIPTTNVNVIVLRTLDNDGDPNTTFGAGGAADLIADQLNAPGAGFFIYFNSFLKMPRLVFSTNLDDKTADLKVMARLTNFVDNPGALADFTAEDFAARVPEPTLPLLLATACAALARRVRRR